MKRRALPSGLCLALLLGGCPKRQTAPILVYKPSAPPPAPASAGTQPGGTMVIQEAAPPAPQDDHATEAEAAPQEPASTKAPARTRRRVPPASSAADAEQAPENAQPAATVPALQPRESPQQQNELRSKIHEMNQAVQARLTHVEQTRPASLDRRTLEEARLFLAQSERALESGDFQRAANLARKASLLVDALEQKR